MDATLSRLNELSIYSEVELGIFSSECGGLCAMGYRLHLIQNTLSQFGDGDDSPMIEVCLMVLQTAGMA
jgi:hypothetical protein